MLTPIFAAAESRPTGSKAAIKEARGGDLGGAAMTALGEGDQVLATFLKGLELLSEGGTRSRRDAVPELDADGADLRAVAAVPGRDVRGRQRHKEAAGLLQSAATRARPRRPAEPDHRAHRRRGVDQGRPAGAGHHAARARGAAAYPDARARKLLGVAYVLGGRPADAVAAFTPYLDANPTDQAALLGALFGTYIRHLNAPQPATLAADRTNMAKWAKAYAATKAPTRSSITWGRYRSEPQVGLVD